MCVCGGVHFPAPPLRPCSPLPDPPKTTPHRTVLRAESASGGKGRGGGGQKLMKTQKKKGNRSNSPHPSNSHTAFSKKSVVARSYPLSSILYCCYANRESNPGFYLTPFPARLERGTRVWEGNVLPLNYWRLSRPRKPRRAREVAKDELKQDFEVGS